MMNPLVFFSGKSVLCLFSKMRLLGKNGTLALPESLQEVYARVTI
jgi:hypothetical protein